VNIWATEGLESIARASSPPGGRARIRLTRILLLRSQESRIAERRVSSGGVTLASVEVVVILRCEC